MCQIEKTANPLRPRYLQPFAAAVQLSPPFRCPVPRSHRRCSSEPKPLFLGTKSLSCYFENDFLVASGGHRHVRLDSGVLEPPLQKPNIRLGAARRHIGFLQKRVKCAYPGAQACGQGSHAYTQLGILSHICRTFGPVPTIAQCVFHVREELPVLSHQTGAVLHFQRRSKRRTCT